MNKNSEGWYLVTNEVDFDEEGEVVTLYIERKVRPDTTRPNDGFTERWSVSLPAHEEWS